MRIVLTALFMLSVFMSPPVTVTPYDGAPPEGTIPVDPVEILHAGPLLDARFDVGFAQLRFDGFTCRIDGGLPYYYLGDLYQVTEGPAGKLEADRIQGLDGPEVPQ